jgi:hypothetical protein
MSILNKIWPIIKVVSTTETGYKVDESTKEVINTLALILGKP